MTKFGKRKSHENSGYKRERESGDANKNMSPTNSFVHQLVKISEPAKEGDKFFAVTPLSKKKKGFQMVHLTATRRKAEMTPWIR